MILPPGQGGVPFGAVFLRFSILHAHVSAEREKDKDGKARYACATIRSDSGKSAEGKGYPGCGIFVQNSALCTGKARYGDCTVSDDFDTECFSVKTCMAHKRRISDRAGALTNGQTRGKMPRAESKSGEEVQYENHIF